MDNTFDANELLDPLSGLELRKVAQWLKDNDWWDEDSKTPLTPQEEQFYMALHKIGENKHRLSADQEESLIAMAEKL